MPPINFKDIVWEEDDSPKESKKKSSAPDDSEMADWLAHEHLEKDNEIQMGSQVQGIITSISETSNDVLVEVTRRLTGVLDKNEIIDADTGQLKFREGDSITAYVLSRREGDMSLTMNLSQSRQAENDLFVAFQNHLPVKGRVVKENPGGFDITLGSKKAFCPVSQIDRGFVVNKTEYLNKDFNFLIEKWEGGRNIVVSRSKLLDMEAAGKIDELRAKLDQDVYLEGVVKEVRDFGAFIDLGGFEGLVHVSEISHSRVARAADFLTRGEKVRVKVVSIDEKDGKTRIALSMKAAAEDPWTQAAERYQVGKTYNARILRLEKFGAFAELESGIEGLIHVSEMSWTKRVMHAQDILKEGETVSVRVTAVDSGQRRISLSLKDTSKDPWLDAATRYPAQAKVTGKVVNLKDFGAIIEIEEGLTGLVPVSMLRKVYGENYRKRCSPPQTHTFTVLNVDTAQKRVLLAPEGYEGETDEGAAYREYQEDMKRSQEAAKVIRPSQMGSFGSILAEKLKSQQK